MDYDQIILFFDRPMVESGNVDNVIVGLRNLIANKESIEKYAGKVTFTFDGWDSDPREMYDIPEAKNWFRKLTDRFPYWLVFLDRANYCLPVAITILLDTQEKIQVEDGLINLSYDSKTMTSLLGDLFASMNELCEEYGIDEETNRTWTKEIGECLQAYTERSE